MVGFITETHQGNALQAIQGRKRAYERPDGSMKDFIKGRTDMDNLKKIFRGEFLALGLITVMLIIAAFYLFSITVRSSAGDDNSFWNEYYAPAESEYVSEVRGYLDELGYCNPGVDLTHVTDSDLMRTYTVIIHHQRFGNLSSERKEEIEEAVLDMCFADERCSFRIELI